MKRFVSEFALTACLIVNPRAHLLTSGCGLARETRTFFFNRHSCSRHLDQPHCASVRAGKQVLARQPSSTRVVGSESTIPGLLRLLEGPEAAWVRTSSFRAAMTHSVAWTNVSARPVIDSSASGLVSLLRTGLVHKLTALVSVNSFSIILKVRKAGSCDGLKRRHLQSNTCCSTTSSVSIICHLPSDKPRTLHYKES